MGQSHLGGQRRQYETARMELFLEMLEKMGKGRNGLTRFLLERAPVLQVVPKPASTGGIVDGAKVLPKFDTEILVEEIVARSTQKFVVDVVAASDCALIE